jgi:flagellar biosynthesis protein FlhB
LDGLTWTDLDGLTLDGLTWIGVVIVVVVIVIVVVVVIDVVYKMCCMLSLLRMAPIRFIFYQF